MSPNHANVRRQATHNTNYGVARFGDVCHANRDFTVNGLTVDAALAGDDD